VLVSSPERRMSAVEPGRRHIVVGVDGSSESRAALHWAVGQAGTTGSLVNAIAVWSPAAVTGTPYGVGIGPVVAGGSLARPGIEDEAVRSGVERMLDDAIAALPPEAGRRVERQVLAGDAATVLVDAARDAALLVLGNSGRGGLVAAVTGSVALSCAHHARCPVVLVPAGDA
jgi:nucleotide-binding universal stress UspA family protein